MQQAKEESLYYESGNFRLQALDDGEAVEVEVERLMGFYRDFVDDGAAFDEARVRALTNAAEHRPCLRRLNVAGGAQGTSSARTDGRRRGKAATGVTSCTR